MNLRWRSYGFHGIVSDFSTKNRPYMDSLGAALSPTVTGSATGTVWGGEAASAVGLANSGLLLARSWLAMRGIEGDEREYRFEEHPL